MSKVPVINKILKKFENESNVNTLFKKWGNGWTENELPISLNVNPNAITKKIEDTTGQKVIYISQPEQIEDYLEKEVQEGDLIMTVGAGDGYKIAEALVDDLQRRANNE